MAVESENERTKESVIFDEFHDPDFSLGLGLLFLRMQCYVDLATWIYVFVVPVSEISRLTDPYVEVVNVTQILTGRA